MLRSIGRPLVLAYGVRSFRIVVLTLSLLFLTRVPPVQASPAGVASRSPLTLLTPIGTLNRDVSASEVVHWKQALYQGHLSNLTAARLHLWLGEIEIARNKEPQRALEQFQQAQRLSQAPSPVYGCAAFDRALTLFRQGAYALAAPAFQHLLQAKPALCGYNRSECGLWARHAAACAGYHQQHEKLGITEPRKLDPLCGVAALAAWMKAHDRPYDHKTLLSHCRMTGLGNNMQDLRQCARRLGMPAWIVKADDEGLKALPKPLVAYVELDHFVAVTRADEDGVSYLCSDCGAWPGGRRDLTWKQWRAMDCNLYLVVAKPGSVEDRAMGLLSSPHPGSNLMAGVSSGPRLAALGRSTDLVPRAWMSHLLGGHVVLYTPENPNCGQLPESQQCPCPCNCPKDGPGGSGGFGGLGGDGGGGYGGAGRFGLAQYSNESKGPGKGDPTDLASGEEEYTPDPDLTVYNPIGPSVVWQRHYGSMRGAYQVPVGQYPYAQYALGNGWNNTYDRQMTFSSSTAYFYFPNGSDYAFTLPATPTASTPQVACPAMNGGVPMLCVWSYNPDGSYSFVFTDTARKQWVFSSLNGYALTRLVDQNGNFINFNYSTPGMAGFELTSITDSNNVPLLTIHHNAAYNITSVSDRYDRSVYYTLQRFRNVGVSNGNAQVSDELIQVSQIVRTGAVVQPMRYTYGYILNTNGDGSERMPALHTISVLSPSGKGTATATINYNGVYVGSLVDANGNTRTYTPVDGNDTQVTVTDAKNNLVTSYTVGFDAQMRMTYRTDGTNKTRVYQATYLADNAYEPYQVINGNGQTTTYTYDQFGQVTSVTTPRNVTTTYTFDYGVFPLGELKQIQEGTKSPIRVSYFGPSGLIQTISLPLPGTSGGPSTATTSLTYDALGNVLSVQGPGNDATATITTTYNYTRDGSYSQPDAINQPLTVTDNLGHVTHYRYDAQGNLLTTVDALGNRADSQYNLANQATMILAPAIGDVTSEIGVNRSSLIYQNATKTYHGTVTLTNTSQHAIQGCLLMALTNLTPGITLANSSGTYVNSPTRLSGQVALGPRGHTSLAVSFLAPSGGAVKYGAQIYLTDSQGNPIAQRSTTQMVYLYPGGPMLRTSLYDETGTLIRQINQGYGKEGEMLSISGSAETVTYTYDGDYRRKTLADGNRNTTKWAYNTAGWLASVTYPMGDSAQFPSYDPMGNLLKRIDGRGIETDYVYNDPESKLTNASYINSASYPNVSQYSVSIDYDGYGRAQDVYDFSGHTHLAYDDLNDKTGVDSTYTSTNGSALPTVSLAYGFNPDGSRQSMSVQTSTMTYGWSTHYDAAGRSVSLTNPFNETTQWSYLDNNWLAAQRVANGALAQYAYNRRGFLNDLTHYTSGAMLLSDVGAMSYDAAADRLTKSIALPAAPGSYSGQAGYVYDIKNQVVQEQSTIGGGYNNLFTYDPAGNALSFKGNASQFNADNQFANAGFAFDGEGNPTTYNGSALTFDPENHMTSFGSVLTAGYRADGLRAWKQTSTGTVYVIYDGIQPVCELDGAGAVTAVNTFGANGLISRYGGAASVFYTFDPQGNVLQRLDPSGNPLNSSLFDAFGAGISTSAAVDPFGYGAQWSYSTDIEDGLNLLGSRYQDPATGRFLTRDLIRYEGGINVYSYVYNDPVMLIDPPGLLGAGIQLGGSAAGGVGWGTAGTASIGGGIFGGGKYGTNPGVFSSYGGFADGPDSKGASRNATIGLYGGIGPSLFLTSVPDADCLKNLTETDEVMLGIYNIQVSHGNGDWMVSFGLGVGLGFTSFSSTTTTAYH